MTERVLFPAGSHPVTADAAALRRAWDSGDPADSAHRRACSRTLAALRRRWRADSSLFDAESVDALRAVAEGLRSSAPSPDAILQDLFGYAAFRPGQREIIDTVLARRDCIGVMPTGAGKSLTYQIPARILGGCVLVVSPLIALMKDQVDSVTESGLAATFLNSSLDAAERSRRMRGVAEGAYELVYAAPEGLEASAGRILEGAELSLIAVDEAHCISQWGHDFRPAYRNLAGLKRRFGKVPILALTATATHAVVRDIREQLAMDEPALFRGSFFRSNLRIAAVKKGAGGPAVREEILALARRRRGQSGIVYCLSRKSTEQTAEYLARHRIRAEAYHAGLSAAERTRVQDGFQRDEIDVVVATIAFGMGIDKPNVRYVVHRDMPRSIEAYYQEIGRAGRDGLPSDCVLFYSWADVLSYERMLAESEAAEGQADQVRAMFRLADRRGCRHAGIVRHFGETIRDCGSSCDECGLSAEPASPRAAAPGAPDRRTAAPVRQPGRNPKAPPLDGEDAALATRLRELRRGIAAEIKKPAFVVFSDVVLQEIVARRPRTATALLAVPGIGPGKLERYGAAILAAVAGESGENAAREGEVDDGAAGDGGWDGGGDELG